MKKILKQHSKKKAISELVAYVLLVGLAVSMSIAIYSWLRFYVNPGTINECPDGVSLIIFDYNCSSSNLNIEVQNKGLFNISGYILRINNLTKGLPVIMFANMNFTNPLKPHEINFSKFDYSLYGTIKEVELEPFRIEKDRTILCDKAVIRQQITGC